MLRGAAKCAGRAEHADVPSRTVRGGGINWGLVGLFQFDFVGWLLGGSSSIWSRIVFTLVGVAAICGIPGLFTDEAE